MKQGLILGATTLILGLSVTWAAWDVVIGNEKNDWKKPGKTTLKNSCTDSTANHSDFTSLTSKPLVPVMQVQ